MLGADGLAPAEACAPESGDGTDAGCPCDAPEAGCVGDDEAALEEPCVDCEDEFASCDACEAAEDEDCDDCDACVEDEEDEDFDASDD